MSVSSESRLVIKNKSFTGEGKQKLRKLVSRSSRLWYLVGRDDFRVRVRYATERPCEWDDYLVGDFTTASIIATGIVYGRDRVIWMETRQLIVVVSTMCRRRVRKCCSPDGERYSK